MTSFRRCHLLWLSLPSSSTLSRDCSQTRLLLLIIPFLFYHPSLLSSSRSSHPCAGVPLLYSSFLGCIAPVRTSTPALAVLACLRAMPFPSGLRPPVDHLIYKLSCLIDCSHLSAFCTVVGDLRTACTMLPRLFTSLHIFLTPWHSYLVVADMC